MTITTIPSPSPLWSMCGETLFLLATSLVKPDKCLTMCGEFLKMPYDVWGDDRRSGKKQKIRKIGFFSI